MVHSSVYLFADEHYATAGENNWKESQYKRWTMTDRVKFLAQLGTPHNRITERMKQMKPPIDPR